MGRGNRGKKKTVNIIDLLDEAKNDSSDKTEGGFSYSHCVTKKNKTHTSKFISELDNESESEYNYDLRTVKQNSHKINSVNNYVDVDEIDSIKNENKIINNEPELFEKMMYVDKFVTAFWNRIYICEQVKEIIIENQNDNVLDDCIYDEY
jgi:hypothetical protein